MAEVPSTSILSLGSAAPDFSLPDASGKVFDLQTLRGSKGLLLFFACNHCPYVVHLAEAIAQLAASFKSLGIGTVAISSNDIIHYPQDAPHLMVEFAKKYQWNFPYLYDESQEVALAYHAACTPDFYLFDESLCLYYAGQFDSSRPKNQNPVTGEHLRAAADAMLNGLPAPVMKPSTGCNIKWKPGHEPTYFLPK
jgi:peroxiredoxin